MLPPQLPPQPLVPHDPAAHPPVDPQVPAQPAWADGTAARNQKAEEKGEGFDSKLSSTFLLSWLVGTAVGSITGTPIILMELMVVVLSLVVVVGVVVVVAFSVVTDRAGADMSLYFFHLQYLYIPNGGTTTERMLYPLFHCSNAGFTQE